MKRRIALAAVLLFRSENSCSQAAFETTRPVKTTPQRSRLLLETGAVVQMAKSGGRY
jgi:hypothetical protein